jgi:hypothetical protein
LKTLVNLRELSNENNYYEKVLSIKKKKKRKTSKKTPKLRNHGYYLILY